VARGEEQVVEELLKFARELEARRVSQETAGFTDVREANELIENDANAFLLGAVFTQGIPAERAWAGPYLLRLRLGHLDVARIGAMDAESFAALFARPPALHRFKREMARYVQSAAQRLATQYEGDARRVWANKPTARELQDRLTAFEGVGQKKAAMMTEILSRHFGVEVREPSGSDIAGDVHVCRVMYRTGLSPTSSPGDVIEAARRAYPPRPGLLDLACWLMGRRWCHASRPDHNKCRLGSVCPRIGAG
jgi:uncharacterized HhH-GPD family protein